MTLFLVEVSSTIHVGFHLKKMYLGYFLCFSLITTLIDYINSVELTFELPDNSKECFYQEIGKNKTAILEYQVSPKLKEKLNNNNFFSADDGYAK
jgi:hypothetical protein